MRNGKKLFLLLLLVIANPVFADSIVSTTLFSASPTGAIAVGATSPVAMFEFLNDNSSRIRLDSLNFLLTETGSADPWTTAAAVSADIGTLQLFDDTGLQIGPSAAPTTCGGAIFSSTTFDCSFTGLNFVFPRDSIRVLTIRLAIQPIADITSIRASLLPSVNFNAQQLDDGEDRLRVPIIRVNANLLQVNTFAEESVAPEVSTSILFGIGMIFIAISFYFQRRRSN